jgi:hypothetical protein
MISNPSTPYNLTFQVKKDAPAGPTELTFLPRFANVIDEQLQDITGVVHGVNVTIEKTGVSHLDYPYLPSEYGLSQNYPNPFNPDTDIQYQLPEAGAVTLDVFNVLGQKVVTLVDEVQEAGFKIVKWDGQDDAGMSLPSGIYFYSLKAGTFTVTKKMVLTK